MVTTLLTGVTSLALAACGEAVNTSGGTDGTVTSSRVVNASPPRIFDREALQAIDRWRFQPISSPVTSRRTFNFEPSAQ